MAEGVKKLPSRRSAKKCAAISNIIIKEECKAQLKKLTEILKKDKDDRTEEESTLLVQSPEIVRDIQKRARYRQLTKDRLQEVEDEEQELHDKCDQLVAALRLSRSALVYTGAGISTAASIPDYRGPNGVWTLLQQGKEVQAQDLSDAQPTYTHLSITRLYQEGLVQHVVSQNCDGLHLRSGMPRHALSEVHGNMFIELCVNCEPQREYIRLFDTTEKTGVRRHHTGRLCYICREELRDTIVHFGEKGRFLSPYNWEEAAEAAENADLILCLGSSLKVLRRYQCLWSMHKLPAKRPKLYIVNLQWTPKDELATLKINGRCDNVMELLLKKLGLAVPSYRRELDPIFSLCSPLLPREVVTTTKKVLLKPSGYNAAKVEELRQEICKKNGQLVQRRKRKSRERLIDQKGAIRKKIRRDETDSSSSDDEDDDTDSSDSSTSSPVMKNERLDIKLGLAAAVVSPLMDGFTSVSSVSSPVVDMTMYNQDTNRQCCVSESSPRVCTPGTDLPSINVSEIVEMAACLSGVPNTPTSTFFNPEASHIFPSSASCDTPHQPLPTSSGLFAQTPGDGLLPSNALLYEYSQELARTALTEQSLRTTNSPLLDHARLPFASPLSASTQALLPGRFQPPVYSAHSLPVRTSIPPSSEPLSGYMQLPTSGLLPGNTQLPVSTLQSYAAPDGQPANVEKKGLISPPLPDARVYAPTKMNGARVFSFNHGSSLVLLHNKTKKKKVPTATLR